MCEICKNLKKGDYQGLVFKSVNVSVGDANLDDDELSIYIERDADGNHSISSRYYVGGDELAVETNIPYARISFKSLIQYVVHRLKTKRG